jgi:hypothetical protein
MILAVRLTLSTSPRQLNFDTIEKYYISYEGVLTLSVNLSSKLQRMQPVTENNVKGIR